MKSLVIGEDNKNYGAIRSTDKKNISHLSAAVSKKTPLCYSKVKWVSRMLITYKWRPVYTKFQFDQSVENNNWNNCGHIFHVGYNAWEGSQEL